LSGPAAGVIAAGYIGTVAGYPNIISCDMGGTSFDVSLIVNGESSLAAQSSIGFGMVVRTPMVEIVTIGAGGGSIARVDEGGLLQVGPGSAGSNPGPACYGLGNMAPTVTDANLILGYLNPHAIAGGSVKLNFEKTVTAFEQKIAAPLGLTTEQAALGARRVAASNMIRAIKAVSTERGRDPRQYTLCAFGGNGPMFASEMALELGIKKIIIPPAPGVFSAFGLLYADVEHHYSKTLRVLLREVEPDLIGNAWTKLESNAVDQLKRDGFEPKNQSLSRTASLHYKGQTFELTVPAESGRVDNALLSQLEQSFHSEHELVYGHRASDDEPVELVTVRLIAKGLDANGDQLTFPKYEPNDGKTATSRKAYFGQSTGWQETQVFSRSSLFKPRQGPCIIEEYDATCVVPPGSKAVLNEDGCICLTFNE